MSREKPIIIIGTGLAGYGLGREIRKINQDISIIFVTSDDGRSYSKPMLSTGFSKNKTADQLAQATPELMAEQLNAIIHNFTTVTSIDRASRTITLSNGVHLEYSKLVLAVGAKCIAIPTKGNASEEIHTINNLADYVSFRKALESKKSVFIIGAGLIGCEYANDLGVGGFQVHCADLRENVLSALLPETASKAVQAALQKTFSTVFYLGTHVVSVDKIGDRYGVMLSNGKNVMVDIVLSAIGVRANIEIAGCGLAINKGIVVDQYLRTNDDDIYALGDCAEVCGHLLYFVLPLMNSARALAATLTGNPTKVYYNAMSIGVKTPVCPVHTAPPPRNVDGRWEISGDDHNVRAVFNDATGTLQGFALTGHHISEKTILVKELPPLLPNLHDQ